jgi:hypothetical protein
MTTWGDMGSKTFEEVNEASQAISGPSEPTPIAREDIEWLLSMASAGISESYDSVLTAMTAFNRLNEIKRNLGIEG